MNFPNTSCQGRLYGDRSISVQHKTNAAPPGARGLG